MIQGKMTNLNSTGFATQLLITIVLTNWSVISIAPAWGQGRDDTIAKTGDSAPDSNGTFSGLGSNPVLNDSGQVAFLGNLTGTSGGSNDNSGIFLGSDGNISQIVRKGQSAPDGNGTFSWANASGLNNSGQVAVIGGFTGTSGGSSDDRGIFRASGDSITQIARTGQSSPDSNGSFSSFGVPLLNSSGQLAFTANLTGTSGGSSDNFGLFRGSDGGITQIARRGQAAPDNNGSFSFFSVSSSLNDLGEVAFTTTVSNTSDNSSRGVFLGSGETITQIARRGQSAPDGNGTFNDFVITSASLNNSGQVAFRGTIGGASPGSNSGIFRGTGDEMTQIARAGQAAPDSNGSFSSFVSDSIALNDSGQVAFYAFLTDTSGGSSDDSGIFRGSGDNITQIARRGQAAPDNNGAFAGPGDLKLNDSGQVAFLSSLTGTSGGAASASDNLGIFTGDGIDLLQVVRRGDSLAGSTVRQDLRIGDMNRFGQIAYRAELTSGDYVVSRWTPDLHWRGTTDNSWDIGSNWTLSLNPGDPHDVFIDPSNSLTVAGPTSDTTVRSLQIGGGSGQATLKLHETAVLTATNGVTIESHGILGGSGTIDGDVVSAGTIAPGDSAGSLVINGSLTLHASSLWSIELGGLGTGQFDQVLVAGDFNLAGDLFVSLIDGHALGFNQQYLIGEIGGSLLGQFSGLGEGDLVGNFGGHDLFITYSAGGGSNIGLFTAVPEPSSVICLGICMLSFCCSRRRKLGLVLTRESD